MFLIISNSAFSVGWSGWTTVTEIYTGTGIQPLFKLSNLGDAGTGCDSYGYIRFPELYTDEHPGGARSFEVLREAFLDGREVNVFTNNCDSYPLFQSIKVR